VRRSPLVGTSNAAFGKTIGRLASQILNVRRMTPDGLTISTLGVFDRADGEILDFPPVA
jgi:hypothetical protein